MAFEIEEKYPIILDMSKRQDIHTTIKTAASSGGIATHGAHVNATKWEAYLLKVPGNTGRENVNWNYYNASSAGNNLGLHMVTGHCIGLPSPEILDHGTILKIDASSQTDNGNLFVSIYLVKFKLETALAAVGWKDIYPVYCLQEGGRVLNYSDSIILSDIVDGVKATSNDATNEGYHLGLAALVSNFSSGAQGAKVWRVNLAMSIRNAVRSFS